jgi:hypothetical protein
VFADFSALSPTWLSIELPLMFLTIALFTVAVSRGGVLRVRRVPAWTSASVGVGRQTQYTSFGYANPMRKVLANLLRTRSELHAAAMPATASGAPLPALAAGSTPATIVAASNDGLGTGSPYLHGPDVGVETASRPGAEPEVGYRVDVVEGIERYLYQPLATALFAVVAQAKRLQSGRLDAYMAYMLIAVVAVLAVVAGTV